MLAIIQNADTPQILSTAEMLRVAGYDQIRYCGPELRRQLVNAGCDTVLGVESMYAMGYDRLETVDPSITAAEPDDMDRADLFCEIKVRNVPKITEQWSRLKGRMLYLRVNGAQPEICPKGGDEVNLPCPIVTACLWYGLDRYRWGKGEQIVSAHEHAANRPVTLEEQRQWAREVKLHDTESMAYVCWPPYPQRSEYDAVDRSKRDTYREPYCVAHSAPSWGYRPIIEDCRKLGVSIYGNNAPAGQISHRQVVHLTSECLALVHLKSVDCPGWALYEAILSGCPVVTGRLLNSRMLAYGLLEDGVTCYEFGAPATREYGRGDMDYPRCLADIESALTALARPETNRRIGEACRKRLNELMWNADRDGHSFREFMRRHYG